MSFNVFSVRRNHFGGGNFQTIFIRLLRFVGKISGGKRAEIIDNIYFLSVVRAEKFNFDIDVRLDDFDAQKLSGGEFDLIGMFFATFDLAFDWLVSRKFLCGVRLLTGDGEY